MKGLGKGDLVPLNMINRGQLSAMSGDGGSGGTSIDNALQQEDGFFILQEDSSYILLEA